MLQGTINMLPYIAGIGHLLKQRGLLTALAIAVLIAISLPWHNVIGHFFLLTIIGIPVSFAAAILLIPLVILLIVSSFIRHFEDIDRHTEEWENE